LFWQQYKQRHRLLHLLHLLHPDLALPLLQFRENQLHLYRQERQQYLHLEGMHQESQQALPCPAKSPKLLKPEQ
jgi:hypothetical protein